MKSTFGVIRKLCCISVVINASAWKLPSTTSVKNIAPGSDFWMSTSPKPSSSVSLLPVESSNYVLYVFRSDRIFSLLVHLFTMGELSTLNACISVNLACSVEFGVRMVKSFFHSRTKITRLRTRSWLQRLHLSLNLGRSYIDYSCPQLGQFSV